MREKTQVPTIETPLTKPEAVRRAIAVLGYRAGVPQILDYVREHYGIGSDPLVSQATAQAAGETTTETQVSRPSAKKNRGKERPVD